MTKAPAVPSGLALERPRHLRRWVVRAWLARVLAQVRTRPALWIAGLLLVRLGAGLLVSVLLPLHEGYDEWGHYAHVEYVSRHWSRPPQDRPLIEANDESHQLPAYYFLAALPVSLVDPSSGPEIRLNPFAQTAEGEGGMNFVLHPPEERFPYRGRVLAAHLARGVSVLLSLAVPASVWGILRILRPADPLAALAGAAVSAFTPQMLFMGSTVTNDIAVAGFGALCLYFLSRWLANATVPSLALAVLTGAAAVLSKENGLVLVPVLAAGMGLGVAVQVRRGRARRLLPQLLGGAVVAAPAVLLWSRVYGTYFGQPAGRYQRVANRAVDLLVPTYALPGWLHPEKLPAALASGPHNFWSPISLGPADHVLALACLLALFVLLWGAATRRVAVPSAAAAVALLGLLAPAAIVFWALTEPQRGYLPGWRYGLAAMTAVGVAWGAAGSLLAPLRVRAPVLLILAVTPALLGPGYLGSRVLSRYEAPRFADEASLAAMVPLRVSFGGEVELLGYSDLTKRVAPDEQVEVTLYWRRLSPMSRDYSVAVKALDPSGAVLGVVHAMPARGFYPTSSWEEGRILADRYRVRVRGGEPPSLLRLGVSVFEHRTGEHLTARAGEGAELGSTLVFGRSKLGPAEAAPAGERAQALFGESLALLSWEAFGNLSDGRLEVTTRWAALGRPGEIYHLSLQLVDERGQLVAQADGPPRDGAYPTDLWEPGEVVADQRALQVPPSLAPGTYELRLVVYHLDDLDPLPVEGPGSGGEYLLLGRWDLSTAEGS